MEARSFDAHTQYDDSDASSVTDFSLRLTDEFDDAKRRVTLRGLAIAPEDQKGCVLGWDFVEPSPADTTAGSDADLYSRSCSDSPVVLDHAIVTEAPLYSLEGLLDEQLEDDAAINAIVSDIAECLHFWHREARLVHGNVVRWLSQASR